MASTFVARSLQGKPFDEAGTSGSIVDLELGITISRFLRFNNVSAYLASQHQKNLGLFLHLNFLACIDTTHDGHQ